jgi:prevent-host-death family protein
MANMVWQVQEAKQRFSEVLRRAKSDGPQVVTKHGRDIAVVIDIEEYHRLAGTPKYRTLNEALLTMPKFGLTNEEVDELFARSPEVDNRPPLFEGPEWKE